MESRHRKYIGRLPKWWNIGRVCYQRNKQFRIFFVGSIRKCAVICICFKSIVFFMNFLDIFVLIVNCSCACWSPKGKQIVVAFPNGKLAQYKPDLKLAKTIPCTVPVLPGPFSPIAIQWLSTYQFAVVFIEEKPDAAQCNIPHLLWNRQFNMKSSLFLFQFLALFIVNAPKNAPPTYINYYDITYSQTGPRSSQVFLIHILQW